METAPQTISPSPWREVAGAPGVLTAEKHLRGDFPVTSTAVACPGDRTVVVSPLPRPSDALLSGLEDIGKPAALIAPNHFHYMGVPGFRERYGDLPVIAGTAGHKRLSRKLSLKLAEPAEAAAMLPAHVSILEPAGLRSGETWLRIEGPDGITWVVGDAFFHLAEVPRGMVGLGCRMVGVTSGLKVSRTFSILMLAHRRTYLDWLHAALEKDRPTGLVPGHGEIIHADPTLPDRLREATHRRLGRS